jgi:hypothetical protein
MEDRLPRAQAEPGRDLAGRRDALGGYQGAAIVVAALANLAGDAGDVQQG